MDAETVINKLEAKAGDRSLPPEERLRFYEKAANLRATQKGIARHADTDLQMVKLKVDAEDQACGKRLGIDPIGAGMFVFLMLLIFIIGPLLFKASHYIMSL